MMNNKSTDPQYNQDLNDQLWDAAPYKTYRENVQWLWAWASLYRAMGWPTCPSRR